MIDQLPDTFFTAPDPDAQLRFELHEAASDRTIACVKASFANGVADGSTGSAAADHVYVYERTAAATTASGTTEPTTSSTSGSGASTSSSASGTPDSSSASKLLLDGRSVM